MAPSTATPLLDTLRELPLLTEPQLQEVADHLQERFPDAAALTTELVRRGWLTTFQRDCLLQGRGRELVLGPYLLLRRLGRGGMGEVFQARHVILNRLVALKVARKDVEKDATDERRFLREIQATAQLAHPNIVTAYDAARVDGAHVFAMEYVEGTDLGRLLRHKGTLPVGDACAYVRQAALGLQHAHEKGLVHRDLKPANLLVTRDGKLVKISDLGLVRLGNEEGQLTTPGLVIGTPDYLAPEQATNSRNVDIRADLYSLGCTLYHFLTGRPPFTEGTALEKLFKHIEEQPAALETLRPDVPAGLVDVVNRMMAKKPADRYQTPAELAEALAPFCTPPALLPPPPAACTTPPDPELDFSSSAFESTVCARRGDKLVEVTPAPAAEAALAAEPKAEAAPEPAPAPAVAASVPLAGSEKKPASGTLAATANAGGGKTDQPPAPAPAPEAPPRRRLPSRRTVLIATGLLAVVAGGVKLGRDWFFGKPATRPPVTNGLGMQLVWVPAGSFTMGSPADEAGRRDDEGPPHRVTITRPFYLSATEVTVGQFRAFVDATRYQTEAEREGKGKGALRWSAEKGTWEQDPACTWRHPGWEPNDDEPVVCVSRFDALAFCRWLNMREVGRIYRPPTEAEWEYACRAGTTTAYAGGAGLEPGLANFTPGGASRPVRAASFPANAWGLHDLHGNVWEWCIDYYSPTYYRDGPTNDPLCARAGDQGVLRGGSWHSGAADCRCAARLAVPLDTRRTDAGFRVLLESGVR